MAGPGGTEAGRVAIKVLPDTTRFAPSLQSYLDRIERRAAINIDVGIDSDEFERGLARLLDDQSIRVDIDTGDAEAQLARLTADRTARVDVDVDRGRLNRPRDA